MHSAKSIDSSSRHSSQWPNQDVETRKRVAKACDRCRLKKIKCDGQLPCPRCQTENALCRFGDRKKSVERKIPPGYVEYLEEQQQLLVRALRKTWSVSSSTFGSDASRSTDADVPVNTILTLTGCMSDSPTHSPIVRGPFGEDFNKIQDRLDGDSTASSPDSSKLHFASTATSSVSSPKIKEESKPVRKHQGSIQLASAPAPKRPKTVNRRPSLGPLKMPPPQQWPRSFMPQITPQAYAGSLSSTKPPSPPYPSTDIESLNFDNNPQGLFQIQPEYSMDWSAPQYYGPHVSQSHSFAMNASVDATANSAYQDIKPPSEPRINTWLDYQMSEEPAPTGWFNNYHE